MHVAVVGISGAGKGLLMKRAIIPAYRKQKKPVLVLDPQCAPDWGDVQFQTDDPYKFLALAQSSRGCVLVIEECDESLRASAKQERDLKYLATRSRNDCHIAYFSAQRALQIPPSYRNQCSTGYVFMQTAEDADVCCSLFNAPILRDVAPTLPLGTCLRVSPGKNPVKYRVF